MNKHFYISMARRFDDSLCLSYSRTETVQTSRDLKHDIVRTVLARYNLHSGLEIGMIGEVPGGTGLGSSSAVTVGLLHAVRTFLGLECSADTLAKESVIIETELLKKPIGWQDQYGGSVPRLEEDTVQSRWYGASGTDSPGAREPNGPWKLTPCSCTRARRETRRRCCQASHQIWMPINPVLRRSAVLPTT